MQKAWEYAESRQDCSEDSCLRSSVFHRNEKRKANTAASMPASESQTVPLRYARSSSERSLRHRRGNMRKAAQDCSEGSCLRSSVFHRNEKRKAKTAANTPASESQTVPLRYVRSSSEHPPSLGIGICGKRLRTVPRALVCVPAYSIETKRERQRPLPARQQAKAEPCR